MNHATSPTAAPTNAQIRYGHSAIAIGSTKILVAGGVDGADSISNIVAKGVQVYTVNTSTGAVTSVTTAAAGGIMATARARFPIVAAGLPNRFLVFGGSTALGANGATPDTGTTSVEQIDTSTATPTATTFGALGAARQGSAAINLSVAGASNQVFLVVGGATAAAANGAQHFIGP